MAVPHVPEWLTADFLKSCLESDKDNFQQITITNHTIEPAVPPGNNYGSHIFRAKIHYEKPNIDLKEHSISLIIKVPLSTFILDEFGASLESIYKVEPTFYGKYIKETLKLCKHDIVPKYYTSPNPLCVVLEDLCTSGYSMVDKQELLDFEQCQLYVKSSAKLHALSVAVNNTNPEVIKSLVNQKPELMQELVAFFQQITVCGLQCLAAYLEDKPDYNTQFEIVQKASTSELFMSLFKELMTNPPASIKALALKDPWCTNMMFKYNSSGKVIGVKLFDFQGLQLTSPVSELITFLLACPKLEVRQTKLPELYKLYCDSLNENLAEFGCSERLSFEELKKEVTLLSPMLLIIISVMVPFCIADHVSDIKEFLVGMDVPVKERLAYRKFKGKTFDKIYPYIIDQIADEGVFDYLKEKMNET